MEIKDNKYYFIYFIENHDIFKDVNISLSEKNYELNNMELIFKTEKTNIRATFVINIYRIKFIPDKIKEIFKNQDEFEIELIIEEEGKKNSVKINNIDINHDNYLYNFNFDKGVENGFFDTLEMNYFGKFEMFLNNIIKNESINQNVNAKDDLIYSTLKILSENKIEQKQTKQVNKDKIDFSFLIEILLESYESKYLSKLLELMKPENVEGYGVVPDEKLNIFVDVLNKIEEKIFARFENEENKEEIITNFFMLRFYINYQYFREKLNEMLQNKNINKYLYKNLLIYEDLFNNLILEEEQIIELINLSENLNFHQIKNKLRYNKDFFILLKIINEKRELLLKKYKENNIKDDNTFIDVESFTFPKKEDNINDIFEQIKELISFEIKSNTDFVKFSTNIFEKYINLYFTEDLDKLFVIKNIITLLADRDKNFAFKINMNEIIHKSGLYFSNMGKFKNKQILDFIENDIYYKEKKYEKTDFRSVDILSGIDISSINEEFIKYWKKLNFFKIFQYKKENFVDKVCSLITNIDNLNILFQLLNKSKEEDEKEYDNYSIKKMQTTFEELLYSSSIEKSKNFKNDIIDLIYFSDVRGVNLNNFIEETIEKILDNIEIINVYIELLKKYEISKEFENIIIDYFLNNPINNNSWTLTQISNNSKELRKILFKNMGKYVINENDIYTKKESENFKLLKGLIKSGIFKIVDLDLQTTEYITKSSEMMRLICDKIKKFEINYSTCIKIFQHDDLEKIVFEKLSLISSDDGEILGKKDILKQYTLKIKSSLKDLAFILKYLTFFHKIEKQKDIIDISELIRNIKKGTILDYINEYEQKSLYYITIYKEPAEKNEKFLKSKFYVTLYKQTNLSIHDEKKCLIEVDEKFKKIKKIFNTGLRSSFKDFFNIGNKEETEKILTILLRNFKNKDIELEIGREIDNLANIFEIKNYCNRNKIIENLMILSRKETILNLCNSIKIFIEKAGVDRTDFYKTINSIKSNIYKKKDIISIKKSMEELEDLGLINLDKKNTYYINSLTKLREQPDGISFLLEYTTDECRQWIDLPFESDNKFITPKDIINLEKCLEFMESLEIKKKKLTDKELILRFKELIEKKNEISDYLNDYINNYGPIKELTNNYLDKSEISKFKINSIYHKSEFMLSNIEGKFFFCKYEIMDTKNNKTKSELISFEGILELRDRAQLSKVISGDEKEKEVIKKNQTFVEKVSEINNLYKLVKEIYNKGFPKNVIIEIIINKGKSTYKYENNTYKDYKDLISPLNKMLDDLKSAQIEAYKNKTIIRYIFGRQFNLLFNVIQSQGGYNNDKINEITPFLQYITNNLINKDLILESLELKKTENVFDDLINNCEVYLNQTLEINDINLEKILKDSIINRKSNYDEYKGLYIYYCDQLEKELYQIYKYLTSNIPLAQNILLCNKYTSNEEIISFLYRAILCEFNACFMVGGLELLNSDQKSTMLEILNGLFLDHHENMNSCLIFLYTNKSSDLYQSLDSLKYRKILRIDNTKELDEEKYEGEDIEIIYSDKPGVGKSNKIEASVLPNNYKYFPFGGVISKEETFERLKLLNYDNNTVIHLDLFDTEQIELMLEFLFSILITKIYKYKENIFYISKIAEIKIEIPNNFIDFFAKFPILTLFKKTELTINNLAPLIVSKDLISNEQLVSNYLREYRDDKLFKEDLIFKDLEGNVLEKIYPIKRKNSKKSQNFKFDDAKLIPPEKCQELIFEKIKSVNQIKNPSYFQIKTFIDVLGIIFNDLSRNYFLSSSNLIYLSNIEEAINFRRIILEICINITKYFTQGAFDELLQGQMKTQEIIFGKYDEGKDIENAINDLSKNQENKEFSFKNLNSSILFFHEGENNDFSIITKIDNNNPEHKILIKLNEIYKKKYKRDFLITFKKFTQKDYLTELKVLLNLDNPVLTKDKNEKSDLNSLEEITNNYVFTEDNFTKMIFIIMRIRAGVPVIMMGETGCGKTALIRKLSELMNNGDTNKMKILNIHAGTTDKDIINFIEEKVVNESIKLKQLEAMNQMEKIQKGKRLIFKKKLWVFLDEINTCKSMGLITELMCKKSYQGTHLEDNIIFIGACNPYRQSNKNKEEIGLGVNLAYKEQNNLNDKEKENIKKLSLNSKGKLVYTVNPLPLSLLNYVFNFGNLSDIDEEKYIKNMVQVNLEKLFRKNKILKENVSIKVKDLIKDMIITCHQFIRERYDKSSVSLREINRFNIFFEFFFKYLSYKKNNAEKLMDTLELEKEYSYYQSFTELDIIIYSINLSIYICYYLRLTQKELRDELVEKLNDILHNNEISSKHTEFLFIIKLEQEFLIKNIEIPKGISKNRALLENIFSLFVTINNKVPIFIVGKPGCSKSLSVQLINKSMKGSSSTNSLFKILPKLIINSYQGSMGSTSKGVEDAFKKARNILEIYNKGEKDDKKNNGNNIISMIFFDEMGLAEYSPYNPLKVIHSQLEYDLNEERNKIAFVGISNWRLDASKMNRGIFISIPDPNQEDAMNTSFTIAKSFNELLAIKNEDFFKDLGKIYLKYKQYLKAYHSSDGKEDFHGNRDFYFLVKNIAQKASKKYENNEDISEKDLVELGKESIERNFSGIQYDGKENISSIELFKKYFSEIYNGCEVEKEYDIIQRVKDNINDLNSRYLLVESKSSISTYLLSSILSELNKDDKEYYFFIGSQFKDDLQSEEYILKVLNKVQIYMELGKIIIMKNLDSVYPSMYDLFNQNFTTFFNKKYARLALGSTTNSYSLVNDKFRCIINVNLNEMVKQEAPFLNRFEKQIISFEHLLNEELRDESLKIINLVKDIGYKKKIYKGINYDLQKLLINCDEEEIMGMVYCNSKKLNDKEKILDEILSKISLVLPLDILLNLKFNGFSQKYKNEYKKILNYYKSGEHNNLSKFIQNMKNPKNIVYTFSNKLEFIKNIENIKNPIYGVLNKENIKIISLNSLNSENELERKIDNFIHADFKLCLIQFTPEEGSMMNYIKYFIENKENEYTSQLKEKNKYKKAFIFIMHMKRVFDKEIKDINIKSEKEKNEINKKILKETISHLSDYYQIFIDNLNGSEELSLDNILKMKGKELFIKCLDLDDELIYNIYETLSFMKYNINSSVGELNNETYINKIIHYLENNKSIRKLINDCIMRQMNDITGNLIEKIFKKQNIIEENDIDMVNIVKKYLSSFYKKNLNLLILRAEKDFALASLLSFDEIEKERNNKKISTISSEIFNQINIFTNKIDKNLQEKEIFEIIKKIITINSENYFQNVIFNDGLTYVNEEMEANNINLILGLNLPGFKRPLDNLINKVKDEIAKKYYQNEVNLRECIKEENEDIKTEKQNYFDKLNRFNNSTLIDIEKEEFLIKNQKIFNNNSNELNIFYYLIFNDYYTLYINKRLVKPNIDTKKNNSQNENNDQDNKNKVKDDEYEAQEEIKDDINIENTKKYLKLLVFLKNKYSFNGNNNPQQIFANILNWLKSYEVELAILLKMFSKLDNQIPDLFDLIEKIIFENQIEYEISDNNSELSSITNKVFFYGIESILKVVTSNISIYTNFEKSEDKMNIFLNECKEILQDALQLKNILNLNSKEIYSLQEIIELIDDFVLNNIGTIENISNIIYYFNVQNSLFKRKMMPELSNNLENFYNFIYEKIGNDKNFHKIMNKILFNEFLKINDEEYRLQILKIILKDNKFILNSTQIIKILIKDFIYNSPNKNIIKNIEILSNKESSLISSINSIESTFLDEILLNIFDSEIFHYFESIPLIKEPEIKKKYPKFFEKQLKGDTGIIFDESFEAFKTFVENLESIINKEDNKYNSNLSKLYSISYIKIYLNYFVSFIKGNKLNSENTKEILDFICDKETKFRNVLKIYILKLFHNLIENFEQFKNFNYEKYGIEFHKKYSLWNGSIETKKEEVILNHCFLNLDTEKDRNNFNEANSNFDKCRYNRCKENDTKLIQNIKDFGIDTFLCISINKIISNLGYNDKKFLKDYKKFYNFINEIFNGKCNENLKNLLFLFTDENKFNIKIKPKLMKSNNKNLNTKLFEILLYSFRFCVQSLEALDIQKRENKNKKLLFASIIDKNCMQNINDCYIPGNEIKEDMHLTTLEFVESHLNSLPDNIGCYVCSCGYYYSIQPCGFPTVGETSICPICKLNIGYGQRVVLEGCHGLFRRPGHMRIFKDEIQQRTCMNRYRDSDENVANKTLEKYKEEVIKPILEQIKNGINKVNLDYFLKRDKKIRKLSELSYRILNYLIYSHLFFANCLDFISENDLKNNYLVEKLDCIDILEKDWEIIQEILQGKGIQSIQIFMNLIFKRLSELIKNCEYFTEGNQRDNFEENVENLINKCLSEYNDYNNIFIEENKSQLELDNYNIKTIINELSPPTEDIYPPKDYPLFKYFILTKYSSREDFIKKIGPPNVYVLKYPLLHQYLIDNVDTKKMKYLPAFNEFVNYMIENYSFKISRDDAKKRILLNEPIYKDKGFQDKFNNFIKAWDEVKGEAVKYKCRPDMKKKDLNENDKLIYFLNDDGEIGYGMYIAAALDNFITWQNSFLEPIYNSVAQNGILHCFSKNMKRKLPVQNAKINQTLLIENCFNNSSLYYKFEDIISSFCKRDIFKEDGTINYFNYNSFIYDFASIEEELGNLVLPGKCLFNKEINFVAFWSEGFRGGKSETLIKFYLKYPQNDLNKEEKEKIIEYIKNQKNEKNDDFKSILGSMQLIIFYLSNNLNKGEEKVINILRNAPKYLKISGDCYKFFENEGKDLTLVKMMNVYFFIEHLCYDELINTLNQEYREEIPNDLKIKIKEKLLKSNEENEIIKVNQIAAAVRRYMSRYLVGKRDDVELNEKRELIYDLSRIDLWEEKIGKLENLDELLSSKLYEFKIKIGQVYEFYKLIADKDIIQ